jgi:hypothetical protein
MGARMGPGAYVAAWRAAGRFTAPPHPRAHLLTRGVPVDLPPARNAIYIACTEQIVRYVGSTTRSVQARVREHVRLRERARWEELWVITLVDAISPYGVRLAEERVGKLLDPDDNRRPPGR